LYEAEKEQKNVHDAIVNEGQSSFQLTSVVPPSLDTKLAEIGITFPNWVCIFTNTLPLLKSVQQYPPYSPCGHLFVIDWKNMTREANCARHGFLQGRSTEDVFEYVYQHECTGQLNWSIDALTAYSRGAGSFTYAPTGYIGPELSRNEELAAKINASEKGAVTMQFADPVSPLN
jgi:hypothetical protein